MKNKITAIYFNGDVRKRIQISSEPELKELQALVKGYIEIVPLPNINPEGQRLHLICNEEGKMLFRHQPTLFLKNEEGYLLDIVFGPCLICGDINSHGDVDIYSGLTEEDFERVQSMFGVGDYGQK